MKKALILAGITTVAFACTNDTKNTSGADSSSHVAHHGTTADTANNNPVKETMDRMMHNMHGAKATGNNDIDFAAMMVEHHKGAVEMSKVELEKGRDAELKAFAQKVIDDQNKEIGFMEEFISKSPKTSSENSAEFQKALNGSMMAMMNDSTTIYNDIDKDFAAQMIPHHQSAVDMAKAYLEYGRDKSLRMLCENIISSQTKEITWLKDWLVKNGKH
jgi:uncharacterized protein (DUF305 family)